MGHVIGLIDSGCPAVEMMGLTTGRPLGALPFGGRYRLLDFSLSNMVNSGLRTVGIITPFHYRSVLDHLRAGKEWLLDRKTGGLFILPGYGREGKSLRFSLRDLVFNADFFHKDRAEHVIMSCSNLVINIHLAEAVEFHVGAGADATLIYLDAAGAVQEEPQGLFVESGKDDRIRAIEAKPGPGYKLFLDMLVIRKKFLWELLQSRGPAPEVDLLAVLRELLAEARVLGFPFSGYVGRVYSVQSYFRCSMDLLQPHIRQELFMGPRRIHTKIADNPPTRYGARALVTNSLVASGCKIEGRVENSIIFRNVYVSPGAEIKNSILLQKSWVGKNACLENTILDKFVRVKDREQLQGNEESPVVIAKAALGKTGGEIA
ncbi:MAG TPA: glucose-1-phosphate adenylyltransferase subunit GlgD [Clostridia bacterium]|nr:glucose-1-phosphate adenylyltransferase subunit GlgD [Clostridia bacterium]